MKFVALNQFEHVRALKSMLMMKLSEELRQCYQQVTNQQEQEYLSRRRQECKGVSLV